MTPEYIAFVQSRAKPGANILATLTPAKCHLLHMAIGISGEAAEHLGATENNDTLNEREEAGDTLFYATGMTYALSNWTNRDWEELEAGEVEDAFATGSSGEITLVLASGNLLDLVKKYTVYNKPLDEEGIKAALKQVFLQLYAMHDVEGCKELIEENVAKLTKRYATGYSDAAAQERADKPAGE